MKKFVLVSILFIAVAIYTLFSCKEKALGPEKMIEQALLTQVDSFAAVAASLQKAVESKAVNEKQLQQLFLQERLAYKKIEWATEYFVPATSRFVNGPPVQEIEQEYEPPRNRVIEPAGLQVIEGYLFPNYDTAQREKLIQQLGMLQENCHKYKLYFANIALFDWQIFDAVKLELFRIETLGITGFDDPLSLKSMQESAVSIESLREVMTYYTNKKDTENLLAKLDAADKYLATNTDFNTFDRAVFITTYTNPITIGISDVEERLKIYVVTYNRLLRQDAKTLFDTNAFNINAYVHDPSYFATEKKIALGKALFSDPILSTNGIRSCQSCHQPGKAFTDGLVKNTVVNSSELLPRNTPTLLNAALQPSQFYDLRATSLENQSFTVIQNKKEMHGDMQVAVARLWQDRRYRQLFAAAYPKANRTGIDTSEVMNALGSYVRSLTALNSRFDEYMRGNKAAMSQEEVQGFNLFMGKAKCGTCHYMPLFNGNFPPRFIKIDAEVIGVPQYKGKSIVDKDMGRYAIVQVESQKHAFKTPTVRNAARTAPYMHNGVFTTLEEVIDFYNKGGGVGLGMKLNNQTLPFDKLDLTEKERNTIVAFIKSLDSRSGRF